MDGKKPINRISIRISSRKTTGFFIIGFNFSFGKQNDFITLNKGHAGSPTVRTVDVDTLRKETQSPHACEFVFFEHNQRAMIA